MGFDLRTVRSDTMAIRQGVDFCVTPVYSRSKPMWPLVELVLLTKTPMGKGKKPCISRMPCLF